MFHLEKIEKKRKKKKKAAAENVKATYVHLDVVCNDAIGGKF